MLVMAAGRRRWAIRESSAGIVLLPVHLAPVYLAPAYLADQRGLCAPPIGNDRASTMHQRCGVTRYTPKPGPPRPPPISAVSVKVRPSGLTLSELSTTSREVWPDSASSMDAARASITS